MNIDGLFQSPGKQIATFSKIQTLLYRHDPTLHDYFHLLQLDLLTGPRARSIDQQAPSRLLTAGLRVADETFSVGKQQRIKTDVLVCPDQYFGRATETQLFIRTVLGVAQTGAQILCLMPLGAQCRSELDSRLAAAGRGGQVRYLDPVAVSHRIEKKVRWKLAQGRGKSAFAEVVSILDPHGITIGQELEVGFERRAYAIAAWERISPQIDFDMAIVRCHWLELASSVCRTAIERGKQVVTFQQGVIGHSLDVPVTATKYVAFGECSASFLKRANQRFFESVGKPPLPVEYIPGGCLFDTIVDLPDQFGLHSLLLVDVPTAQSDFYGVDSQSSALLELAEKLLSADFPMRIVIRPHPYWRNLDFEECKGLVQQYPNRCELSHPAWSLEEDLRRSSAVVGIFSGVLTVASASGLPTIFLQAEDGYTTGDLECFSPSQTLLPDAAFCKLARILTDHEEYSAARAQSLRNASLYYAERRTLDLNVEFFDRLLGSAHSTDLVTEAVQ